MKRTVIIGASSNPTRYSYMATLRLKAQGHEVFPIGIRDGAIQGEPIITKQLPLENIDTVTLYVGPKNHGPWIDYIIGLAPNRVIFNPGTEDFDSIQKIQNAGIKAEIACTLVMLSAGTY